jgi:hypothetical protein
MNDNHHRTVSFAGRSRQRDRFGWGLREVVLDYASRVFVIPLYPAATSFRGYWAEIATRARSEIDTEDQLNDTTSQSVAQCQFALETNDCSYLHFHWRCAPLLYAMMVGRPVAAVAISAAAALRFYLGWLLGVAHRRPEATTRRLMRRRLGVMRRQ